MKPASEKIKDLIIKLKLENPKIPMISNVSSQVSNESQVIKELLIEQIYKKVRWREIMESMFVNDVNLFVEIGPGQTLTGMLKRFNREVLTKNFNNFEDLQNDL